MLLFVLVSGCSNAVWVWERIPEEGGEFREVAGIPFYVKKEVFVQETTYEHRWLNATLTVEEKETRIIKNKTETVLVRSQTIPKSLAKDRSHELDAIKTKIQKGGTVNKKDADKLVSTFKEIPVIEIPAECIGNEVKSTWIVHGGKTYYLNAPLPWFGSASLTQELNSDGTLSKTSVNADTKLAESVASLIPIKEYLTGNLIGVPDSSISPREEFISGEIRTIVYTLSLSVSEEGYRYRFTKRFKDRELPAAVPPIAFDTKNGLFTREAIIPRVDSSVETGEGKKVGVAGTISFPEGWGGSK